MIVLGPGTPPLWKRVAAVAGELYRQPADITRVRDELFALAFDVRRIERALDELVRDAQEDAELTHRGRPVGRFRLIEGGLSAQGAQR